MTSVDGAGGGVSGVVVRRSLRELAVARRVEWLTHGGGKGAAAETLVCAGRGMSNRAAQTGDVSLDFAEVRVFTDERHTFRCTA